MLIVSDPTTHTTKRRSAVTMATRRRTGTTVPVAMPMLALASGGVGVGVAIMGLEKPPLPPVVTARTYTITFIVLTHSV